MDKSIILTDIGALSPSPPNVIVYGPLCCPFLNFIHLLRCSKIGAFSRWFEVTVTVLNSEMNHCRKYFVSLVICSK